MKSLLIAFICLVTATAHAAPSGASAAKRKAGWRESYGGDATVSEFQKIALEIAATLRDVKLAELDDETLESFEENIKTAKLSCGTNLSVDGVEKDAVNYPLENPGRIVLNCDKWNSQNYSPANKIRLVAHEYLFLSGIDDSDYVMSSKMVKHYIEFRNSDPQSGRYLLSAVRSCDVHLFFQLTEEGAELRYKNDQRMDVLHTAITYECWKIVEELTNLGVAPSLDYVTKTNSIALMVQKMANYHFNYQTEKYNLVMNLTKKMVEATPDLLNSSYNNPPFEGLEDKLTFSREIDLCQNKNLALMASKGFTYHDDKGVGASLFMISNPSYKSNKLLSDMEAIGFSLDAKDSCGRSARSLLK